MYLLLGFLLIPIVEIAVFIQVGGAIGLWPTVALVIATAVAGTALLRSQGFAVLGRARESLARNELPVAEVFDGLCLLVAGILLLTPGFVTDTLGLLLFVPPIRIWLRNNVLDRLIRAGNLHVHAGPGRRHGPTILEGEFQEVREPEGSVEPPHDSRWRPPGSTSAR